jgi:hypothetical protein
VGVEGDRGAEAAGAEEGLDAGEGVGELVGVAEGAFEEVALGFAGKGGMEFEGEGDDGGGGGEGVEVGVEEAQEGGGIAAGIRDAELAEMEVAIIEGEGEVDGVGGALGGMEPGAEGVEGALEQEEERVEGFERVFEFLLGLVVLRGAVEIEEAVVFAVEDVVEAGGVGPEAFGESLARQGGELVEGGDAPEMEKVGVGKWEPGARKLECGEGELGEGVGDLVGGLDVDDGVG